MDDLRNMTLADEFTELNRRIHDTLAREHTALLERTLELTAQFAGLPLVCDTDDLEREMTDLGVSLNKFLATVETQRKSDKRVPGESPKLIDKFFTELVGSLPTRLDSLRSRVNTYKNAKIEAERRRVAEERARAIAAQEEAERQRREAERLRQQAEAARIAEAEAAAAADRPAEITQEEMAAKDAEAWADAQLTDAERVAALTPTLVAAQIAPMIKTESGAKSGQRGQWVAKDIDRDMLDLNALRAFISTADLEKYANAYARQYKDTKPLAGARIVQEFNTTFRG